MKKQGWKKNIAVLLVGVVFCVGCNVQPGEESEELEKSESEITIGCSFDTFVLERWLRDRDMITSVAQKAGATVDVQHANGNVETQKEQIKYLIQEEVDVLIVVPVDSYSLVEEIEEAMEKGIKVISYDRMLQGVGMDLYITVDNHMVGALMAETMMERLPDGGNIVMICGPKTDKNAIEVAEAFEEKIEESNLEVVSKTNVDVWEGELGFQALEEVLETGIAIDGVMCGNDGLASNAIKALSERGLTESVIVTGQDADLEACQRITEGSQTMTVYKPIEELASQAAEFAVQMAKGEELTTVTEIKSNDIGEFPYYGLTPQTVTMETMEETIIKSGFHLESDVYRYAQQNE